MRGDRRKHVRFELTKGTVAVLTAKGELFLRVGSLTDVSEGGAALRYDHGAALPETPLRLHLFGPKQSKLAVPGLPCRIVLDVLSTVTPSIAPSGFCTIAFDSLSDHERVMLQGFIRRLKVAPFSHMLREQLASPVEVHVPGIDTRDEPGSKGRRGPLENAPQILLVDDEPMILKLMCAIFESQGYRVITNTSPREALDVFRSNPGEVDLIITDYLMPLMTGAEFARHLLRTRPDVPIILFTGNSDLMTEPMARDLGFRKVAVKPLGREDLIKLVRSVLDQDRPDIRAGTTCSLSDPLQGIDPQGAQSNLP
ncbi:MAG: response regulator [Syntrophobacteraceae bacterium]